MSDDLATSSLANELRSTAEWSVGELAAKETIRRGAARIDQLEARVKHIDEPPAAQPVGWLVDEGFMLTDPQDKYAVPLYTHPPEPPAAPDLDADLAAYKIDGLMERLHDLDWGELPAVGEAATALETLSARVSLLSPALLASERRVARLEAALREAETLCRKYAAEMQAKQSPMQLTIAPEAIVAHFLADQIAALSDAPAAKGGQPDTQ